MGMKFTNNASTTLASGILAGATALTVQTGAGALFPTLGVGDYFYCTLSNTSGSIEIIKVTARTGDTFSTIVRAQDGTSALAWNAGDRVELRLVSASLNDFPKLDENNVFTGTNTENLSTTSTAVTQTLGDNSTKIATTAFVQAAATTVPALSALTSINGDGIIGRNRVINGDMRRSAYNGTTAVTPLTSSPTYIIDRWAQSISQSSKLAFQQVADAPAGFKYSLKVSVAAQYSPLATDQFYLTQKVEGQVITDFQFGSAGAAVVTLSQYIKGSVAGTYSCALMNGAANRSYVGTISVTNSWARAQITLTGDTAGTWATDNTVGLYLIIDLGSGSNFNTTSGSWQAGLFTRTSGSVTFVNQTAGATLNITGVQLELGSIATQWKQHYGIFGGEDQSCQRYYFRMGGTGSYGVAWSQATNVSGQALIKFPVTMRIAPSALEQSGTASHYAVVIAGVATPNTSVPIYSNSNQDTAQVLWSATSGHTAGQSGVFYANNAAAFLGFSAEL